MKRLSDPRYWLSIAALVLGVYVGLEAGAERYIQRQGLRQRAELTELERWKGMVANLGPWAMGFGAAGLTLVWGFCPAPKPKDSEALKRLAESKLSQPLLTNAETQLWVQVLEATKER